MEELLGYMADRIGLDLQGRSVGRILFIVLLYSTLGLLLLIGGLYYLSAHYSEGAVAILTGVILALLGIAFLIRIIVNTTALIRSRK